MYFGSALSTIVLTEQTIETAVAEIPPDSNDNQKSLGQIFQPAIFQ